MAQKVQVLLIDDLDGTEADETVTFALDGKSYEIDLTTANANKLRSIVEPYVEAGRKVSGRRGKSAAGKRTEVSADSATIRAWARSNGWPELKNRGRVPADVRDAFEKAQSGK
ncbi:Lsr2 family protein [Streptomyces sp. NPDC045431]|uniref:histone-like nucleoid-structuring protein Lsr2 n=1 Tax=Streptomyces sp. NPDC045431 TaxID=3155613 RepID=UPI003402F1DC